MGYVEVYNNEATGIQGKREWKRKGSAAPVPRRDFLSDVHFSNLVSTPLQFMGVSSL